MIVVRTEQFIRDFKKLSHELRSRTIKQLQFLATNPRHPSLRIKRIKKTRDIFEGRINKSYRFTFRITHEAIIIRRAGKHDDMLRNP